SLVRQALSRPGGARRACAVPFRRASRRAQGRARRARNPAGAACARWRLEPRHRRRARGGRSCASLRRAGAAAFRGAAAPCCAGQAAYLHGGRLAAGRAVHQPGRRRHRADRALDRGTGNEGNGHPQHAPAAAAGPGCARDRTRRRGMTATRALLRRDLLLAWRRIGDALNPLMFFTMVALVFPLAVTPEAAFMQKLAPGILWVAALLASLIGLGGLFTPDYLDGTLEQQALSPVPLGYIALLRVLSHWMVTGLPLVIL